MRSLQRFEAAAFLLFATFGSVGAYKALLVMGLSDGVAGPLAGAGIGLAVTVWVLLRCMPPRLP